MKHVLLLLNNKTVQLRNGRGQTTYGLIQRQVAYSRLGLYTMLSYISGWQHYSTILHSLQEATQQKLTYYKACKPSQGADAPKPGR